MDKSNQITSKIAELEAKRAASDKRVAEMRKDFKLPLYKKIQLELPNGQLKYPTFYKRVEETQKWAFEGYVKKHKLKVDDDDFAMFWTAFLKGEHKSIADYFNSK